MGFTHGKDSRLLLQSQMFSGYLRAFEHNDEIEMADSTVYGSEGHNFIPGLETGTLSMDGLMDKDATVGGQNETLRSALKSVTGKIITAAPGGLAVGSRVFMIEARETNYALSSPVGDVVSFSASWQSEGQVDHGRVLQGATEVFVTANGLSVDDLAATLEGGSASLHVVENTRDASAAYKVQHSVDGVAWVDLVTFAAVGAGATVVERQVVPGTINRYLRTQWTLSAGTGSITAIVAAARR